MELTDKKKEGLVWPVIIYLVLKPIYLFESGGLQICDYFLIAAIIFELILYFRGGLKFTMIRTPFFKYFFFLIAFQFLVNIIWYIFYQDSRLLLSSVFYVFNYFALIYFVSLAYSRGIKSVQKSLIWGVIGSTAVALIGVFFNRGGVGRNVGFFNYPNHLGLHGLLLVTIIYFLRDKISKPVRLVVIILDLIVVLSSSSKASLIGIFVLLALYLLTSEENVSVGNKIWKALLLLALGAFIYMFFFSSVNPFASNHYLTQVKYRMLAISKENDSNLLTGRGYARILELGPHFLWGLGEGAYSRFDILRNHEVHSMIVNLLVSYGLIGLSGYVMVFAHVIKNNKKTLYNLLGLSGFFLYSITHNCIRNTVLWLVIAVLLVRKNYEET